jgi:putative ABC transport system ATP-binding protein
VIAGLLTASAGDLTVLGRHYADLPSQERIRFRRQNLGFVFQQLHLLPALTAAENVAVPLLAAGVPRRDALRRGRRRGRSG